MKRLYQVFVAVLAGGFWDGGVNPSQEQYWLYLPLVVR
jgi:hypothetical protein